MSGNGRKGGYFIQGGRDSFSEKGTSDLKVNQHKSKSVSPQSPPEPQNKNAFGQVSAHVHGNQLLWFCYNLEDSRYSIFLKKVLKSGFLVRSPTPQ